MQPQCRVRLFLILAFMNPLISINTYYFFGALDTMFSIRQKSPPRFLTILNIAFMKCLDMLAHRLRILSFIFLRSQATPYLSFCNHIYDNRIRTIQSCASAKSHPVRGGFLLFYSGSSDGKVSFAKAYAKPILLTPVLLVPTAPLSALTIARVSTYS